MIRDELVEYKKELFRFIRKCKRIFLYGAGNIAKAYIDIMEKEQAHINGLIVTNDESGFVRGYKVISAKQASAELKAEDGVILAFTGAKKEETLSFLRPANPMVFSMDHLAVLALDDIIRFKPIIHELNNKYGVAKTDYNKNDIQKILIVRLDLIGDFVFTTSFLRELRNNNPLQHITLIVRKQNYALAMNCPYVSEVVAYECPFTEGELSRQCENIKEVEERTKKFCDVFFENNFYDLVFFPRELLEGRNVLDELLIGYQSGARIRIGRQIDLGDIYGDSLYEMVNKTCYSMISRHSEALHESYYTLKMLEDFGGTINEYNMELWLTDECIDYAKAALSINEDRRKNIAVGIMASVPQRTWSTENYVSLFNTINNSYKDRFRFVLFGGDDAVDKARMIQEKMNDKTSVLDLTGKNSLTESLACMSLCDIYIGSNTGLLHFATAMKKPSITIYAELSDGKPTDGDAPERMGACQVPHVDLVPPAGLDGCHGVCRMRYSHCINQITPEQVTNALRSLLSV